MKTILFVNVARDELLDLRGMLERNNLSGARLLLCDDLRKLAHLAQAHEIQCIVFQIKGGQYLEDLEYLRAFAPEVPRVVYGDRLRRKALQGVINVGSVFSCLKKPLEEYEFTAAVAGALALSKGIEDKYRRLHKTSIKQQIEQLNKIGIALSSEHNLERLLELILSQSIALAHCDAGSIYTKEGEELAFMAAQNNTLMERHGGGYAEKFFKKYSFPVTKNRISGYVAATGEILNIRDVYCIRGKEYTFTDDIDKRLRYLTKSMIVAPMKDSGGNILGVLQLINCLDKDGEIIPFDKNLENLIQSLASQAAVSISNARLIEEVKQAHLETILSLAGAAELLGDDTKFHLSNMSNYSTIVAKHLGLEEKSTDILRYAAPMHDIGKIGIPDSILYKPGKLTDSERETMKMHTVYGEQILREVTSEILKASAVVALNHHERWDGTGYPNGLAGDSIPLFGQIVSIADVFDALVSKRCYKEAFDLDNAVREIAAGRNTMFGPRVVDAFMKGMDEIVEVLRNPKQSVIRGTHLMNGEAVEARL